MKNSHKGRNALLVGILFLLLSVVSFGFTIPGGVRNKIVTPTASYRRQTKRGNNLYMSSPFELLGEVKKSRSLAGRIPWHKFRVRGENAGEILAAWKAESHVLDISLIVFFSLLATPTLRFVFNKFLKPWSKNEWDDSVTFHVATNTRQVAKLSFFCYAIDLLEIGLETIGLDNPNVHLSNIASKIFFAYWIFLRARIYKRKLLEKSMTYVFGEEKVQRGKTRTWDKILDGVLFFILFLFWLDVLNVPMGRGLSSVFALGGAGTLAVTLACQDIAKKLMSGLALSTSEIFFEGESIQAGDGIRGNVQKLGWLSTELRGADEKITTIPNTDLFDKRIVNLSRLTKCQVKQSLRFSYDDIDKIPKVIIDIKDEIKKVCPKLITDGSRPFRANWANYQDDHLEVVVNCHFDLKPSGDVYWDNRQQVLEAINRAMQSNKVKFALPASVGYSG